MPPLRPLSRTPRLALRVPAARCGLYFPGRLSPAFSPLPILDCLPTPPLGTHHFLFPSHCLCRADSGWFLRLGSKFASCWELLRRPEAELPPPLLRGDAPWGKNQSKEPERPLPPLGPVTVDPKGGVCIAIHAKPGSKQNAVTDVTAEAVSVAIAAPPTEGEANAELCRYLSKVLELRKSDVVLDKGGKYGAHYERKLQHHCIYRRGGSKGVHLEVK
uniref:Uncharacterized protein n=1 Tax=Capra hircus TaxID=9925 RepID=A0A8C2SHY4_CAPHI